MIYEVGLRCENMEAGTAAYLSTCYLACVLHLERYLDRRSMEPNRSGRTSSDRGWFPCFPSCFETSRCSVPMSDLGSLKIGIFEFGITQSEPEFKARLDIGLCDNQLTL